MFNKLEKFGANLLQRTFSLRVDDSDDNEEEEDHSVTTAALNGGAGTGGGPGTSTATAKARPPLGQRRRRFIAKSIGRAHFYSSLPALVTIHKWFYNYYSRIDEHVVLGALPTSQAFCQTLVKEEGIIGVISMNENYELRFFKVDWAALGVEFLQLQTKDIFEAVSQRNICQGIEFIEKLISDRSDNRDSNQQQQSTRSIYIHCRAGRSRSATLVACYLVHKNNWKPEEAYNFLKSKHSHIILGPAQKGSIEKFYNRRTEKEKQQRLRLQELPEIMTSTPSEEDISSTL